MLKKQDIVVVLKIVAQKDDDLSFTELAKNLGMSPSQVHRSVQRAEICGLLEVKTRQNKTHQKVPDKRALANFIFHGLRHVFPAIRGTETKGVPTGLFVPKLKNLRPKKVSTPVWPDPEGKTKGYGLEPLLPTAAFASREDPELYVLLGLVDAIRGGSSAERVPAIKELKTRLFQRSK